MRCRPKRELDVIFRWWNSIGVVRAATTATTVTTATTIIVYKCRRPVKRFDGRTLVTYSGRRVRAGFWWRCDVTWQRNAWGTRSKLGIIHKYEKYRNNRSSRSMELGYRWIGQTRSILLRRTSRNVYGGKKKEKKYACHRESREFVREF